MSIKIFKNPGGFASKVKGKYLDIEFDTFLAAEQYAEENILPNEKLFKLVTFVVLDLPMAKKIREYLFLDENDVIAYSYRIVEEKE